MALNGFGSSWIFRQLITGTIFATFVLISLTVSARSTELADQLDSVSSRCLKAALEVTGYRSFQGAAFGGLTEDGIILSDGDISVYISSRFKEEDRRRIDTCSFQANDVAEREFGLHAAAMTLVAEGLGLARVRPVTTTNFTFSGCIERETQRPKNVELKTVYLRKSSIINFRVGPSWGGTHSCGE